VTGAPRLEEPGPVTPTFAIRPRRLLLIALVALVIGALAIALAPSSHHGHDSRASAASRASRTTLSDGILAQFPARFDR
jgi:hypothetical protein